MDSSSTTPAPPSYPTTTPAPPSYPNSTIATTSATQPQGYPTGSVPGTQTSATTIPTAGAGKVAALSGAGLAGLLGLAVAAL